MKKIISLALTVIVLLSLSTAAFAYSGKNFDETDFEGMTITYNADGAPIVEDPNATVASAQATSAVVGTTIVNTWLYKTARLNSQVFLIPAGMKVPVLQTNSTYLTVQITYAGYTGWVSSSNLQFG